MAAFIHLINTKRTSAMREAESSFGRCFISFSPKFLDPFPGHDLYYDRDLPLPLPLPLVLVLYPWLRLFSFLWVSGRHLRGVCRGVTRPGGRNIVWYSP